MPQINVTKLSIQGLKMVVSALGRHGATQGYIEAEQEWERPPAPARRQRIAPPQHIVRHGTPEPHVHQVEQPSLAPGLVPDMPTTKETVDELKRRLGKELYKFELDLLGGGRINGKPCGCLGLKHHLGLEATTEELMPMDRNPVYNKLLGWLAHYGPEFTPEEVSKRPPEYYKALANDVRDFRKEVMESESLMAMLSVEDQRKITKKMKEARHGSSDSGDDSDGG